MKKIFLIFILLAASCTNLPTPRRWTPETSLQLSTPRRITELPNYDKLSEALGHSITYLKKRTQDTLQFGTQIFATAEVIKSYEGLHAFILSRPSTESLSKYLGDHFQFYSSSAESVLFTGYYVPRLRGSLVKTSRFQYPLYRTPPDLVSVDLSTTIKNTLPAETPVINRGRLDGKTVHVPYYSRQDIEEQHILDNKGLEILWLDDPIEAFFLHIQGSGVVELPDHSLVTVGFADKNGLPYIAIGKTLIDRGLLKKGSVTMMTIKEVLRAHPGIVRETLHSNPSYCFFRKLPGSPVGSLGVPVTGDYSIATDNSIFPKGALVMTELNGNFSLRLNQDTGGAIRGAGRADLFFGDTATAAEKAGAMQTKGLLFFLAPKS